MLKEEADRSRAVRAYPSKLEGWVNQNMSKLAGWPTHAALDPSDLFMRIGRLERAGCPFMGAAGLTVARVDFLVAKYRTKRRNIWARQVAQAGVD